jgi:hypothetical protein
MEKVNHNQLQTHLKQAWKTKIPVMIWGISGIGKSDAVMDFAKQLAKELKLEYTENGDEGEKKLCFRDIRLSQLESVDLRGIPKIEDGKTKWFVPDWLPQNPDGYGILFFDEANRAFVSVMNAGLELFLDKRIGSYHLPKKWLIILAGNPYEAQYQVNQMSAPLRNRFKHFELQVPTIEEWSAWGIEHDINPNIVAFLNFKPNYLCKISEELKDESFPSPRTWSFSSISIDGVTDLKFMEREIASCVGKGVAMEFSAWYKMHDKVDLDAIIKAPETVKKIKEMSLKFSVVAGLAEKYKSNKDIFEAVMTVCKFIEPEFGYILLGYVKSADRTAFSKKIVASKVWKEVASIYGKFVDD